MSTRPADPAPAGCTAMRLRRTARRVTQIYERHLEPYGLTAAQFGLLAQLRAHAGVSIGALAELMFMDATTLSRNLRPLERRALVAFSRDARDRRGNDVATGVYFVSLEMDGQPLGAKRLTVVR